jgi:nucleotide-binding universal stress UspA family protein
MFRKVLLAVDLQNEADWRRPCAAAVQLCRSFGAELHVLTVVPEFGFPVVGQYFPADAEAKLIEEATSRLRERTAQHVPADVKVHRIVSQGSIYRRVLETAEDCNADLIVVSAHRPELKDYLLGPNAARIVRHSGRSVLVVRD